MTRYNKSEIMKQAHSYRRKYNLNMSAALRAAWLWAKSRNVRSEMIALNYDPMSMAALCGKVDYSVKDRFIQLGFEMMSYDSGIAQIIAAA